MSTQSYYINIRTNQFVLNVSHHSVFVYGEVCYVRCTTSVQKGSLLFLLQSCCRDTEAILITVMMMCCYDVQLCVFVWYWLRGNSNLRCTLMETRQVMEVEGLHIPTKDKTQLKVRQRKNVKLSLFKNVSMWKACLRCVGHLLFLLLFLSNPLRMNEQKLLDPSVVLCYDVIFYEYLFLWYKYWLIRIRAL